MNYHKITFSDLNKEQLQALEGLLSEEEQLLGHEVNHNSLITYAVDGSLPKGALDSIAETIGITYSTTSIPEENWNASWEAEFHPIAIDNFVYLKADFHPQPNTAFEHIIHITPKMSFGTGHHDTTQLVMRQMKALDCSNKSVFDFGTGTGVLAILAEKLGATKILATDNDHWSIENSMENVARNECKHIEVSAIDILDINTNHPYQIILANINRQILLTYMAQLSQLLAPKGTIIFSGFLQEDIPLVEASIVKHGMTVQTIKNSNNWICIEAIKN